MMVPAGIFYFRRTFEKSVTSFVELLLFSVGAFLLIFSLISVVASCVRTGQSRRKLAVLDSTHDADAVWQWLHRHNHYTCEEIIIETEDQLSSSLPGYSQMSLNNTTGDTCYTPPPTYDEVVKMSDVDGGTKTDQ